MSNPSFKTYPQLNDFGANILPDFFINYFAYARVFSHGEYYLLSSNPRWGEDHLITKNRPPAGLINFESLPSKQVALACQHYDFLVGWSEGAYKYSRERFNTKNLLLIVLKKRKIILISI